MDLTADIALGDLDQDGDIDLLEGRFYGHPGKGDLVWLNSARFKVNYIDSGQRLGRNDTRGVAVGDLNGDGNPDIFAANSKEANRVWFGDDQGRYVNSGQELGDSDSTDVVLGDIDKDGDLDAIIANRKQANKVWRNDGSGMFSEDKGQNDLAATADWTHSLVLGDIDGDNDLDLIAGNYLEQNRVYRNNGSGVFIEVEKYPEKLTTYSVVLGDLDGDGDLDLITANYGQLTNVRLNDGSGVFTAPFWPFTTTTITNTVNIALGDVDGDGDLDFVTGNDSQENEVWICDGSESNLSCKMDQQLGVVNIPERTWSIELIDVENDGDLDIISGNYGSANTISLNNGHGIFSDPYPIAGGEEFDTVSTAVADVNGDGYQDLITGNGNMDSNRVWLNDY